MKTNLNYPLHDQFKSPTFNTNNLGYVNGFDGGRDIQIPKPKIYLELIVQGIYYSKLFRGQRQSLFLPINPEEILKNMIQVLR